MVRGTIIIHALDGKPLWEPLVLLFQLEFPGNAVFARVGVTAIVDAVLDLCDLMLS